MIAQHPHTTANPRQLTYRITCLLVLAAIASGTDACAPYRVEYMEDALRQATQSELVHKFGYPQRLKRTKSGEQVWEYDFQGGERTCVTYAVTFNAEDELRQWERRECRKEPPPSKAR
ncbi:MAG TPA: hypothetical protein VLE46_00865 [Nitrospira sp.]|nr:hypothetical protein [Nitrospira sp.]